MKTDQQKCCVFFIEQKTPPFCLRSFTYVQIICILLYTIIIIITGKHGEAQAADLRSGFSFSSHAIKATIFTLDFIAHS